VATILLIEDVEIVRTVLRKFLEAGGHVVRECEGGDEASRIVDRENFDVVVTDLWMKEGDGLEFIGAHATNGRTCSIIAMTGGDPSVTRSRSVEMAQRAGAAEVLIKPVTKTALLTAIDVVLERSVRSFSPPSGSEAPN
jgi:DNA-binding NtrC family response regulator